MTRAPYIHTYLYKHVRTLHAVAGPMAVKGEAKTDAEKVAAKALKKQAKAAALAPKSPGTPASR
jgi:predicted nucleic acid-binding Zn ribbon protein